MEEGAIEASESKYQSIIVACLEAIKKIVPSKRDRKLNTDLQAAIDLLKSNKDTKRDANQYFPLFKQGIELQNKGVTETILKTTKELIALGYLDGDSEDNCIYSESGPQFIGKYPRRLIDGIVETICGVAQEQDENLQLQVIQVLLSIVTSFICKVHDRSLLEVFRALYYIHISTKNPVNYTTSKAALNQIIHITYQRMEISYWRDSKMPQSMSAAMKKEEEKSASKFTILDEYMYCTVHSIVDEACLYAAKQGKEIKRGQKQLKEIKDKRAAEELENKINKSVQSIPVRVAQETQHKEDLNLTNERNAPSGKYGWCIVCRNTANSVCKTTHVPICSTECRSRHIKMLEMLEMYVTYKEEKVKYVEDVILLFRSVCKLSQRDLTSDVNPISLKSKILSLELILSMVQNPPESIRTHPDFLAQIKDHLSESILKNSVSNEKQIFGLSFSIFSALFVNFRSMLKNEIGVFIEEIFLKILDSGNSSYQHKFLILQVFNRIAQNPKFVLEIFVNYDCDIETRNIFERIIDCLGKIAKGKYTKTEHAIIIQPEEERSLKLMALETMTSIVKNCHEYMVACDAAQAAALEEQKTPKSKKSIDPELSKMSDDIETEDLKSVSNLSEGKYEKALKNKSIMNKAVLKFNIKPKNGVTYLVQLGYIASSPESAMIQDTVNFIKNTPGLDKSKIGEYFGDESDFTKKVMHAYIDSLMFKKMPFVPAMRHLVSEFRLPGESQKIDRILMKFGQKYYQDNPTQFVSANAPYELSYAVMILQTTTHNPQVKQKMSLEGFLSMSRDIRRSYNLTDDFMKTIYDDIKQNPITLADDEVAKLKQESALANGVKKKQDLFVRETQHMVKKGKELILKRKAGKGVYEEVKNAEPLRAMFEVAWSGMLAVFSSLFEEHDDGKIWQFCLEGFLYSIKITATLNMPVELDAFVSTLDKFTSLNSLKEIKEKNVECVKLLIDIAMKDGNFLRSAWVFVLQCLSKLDYLHSIFTSMRKDHSGRTSPRKFDPAELEGVAKVVGEIDQSKLDSIFSMSVGLDCEGITDFICNICKVSREELADEANPRTFSLQKLVEVADLNMSRIAFVWKDIWKDVSQHLIEVGTHPNSAILIFALDSLKQLAHKFLIKEELTSYKYQREFLKPFETILLANLKRHDIVDFLVNCVADVCRKCGENIKSGWSIVFNIIGLIGKSIENERVVGGSFAILNQIIQMHYEYLAEYFEDVLSCLLQYCGNPITSISTQALERLKWAVNETSDPSSKLVVGLSSAFAPKDQPIPVDSKSTTIIEDKLWTLLLRGLQCLLLDKRAEIRDSASGLLWEILRKNTFSPAFWDVVYEIILGYIPKSFLHLLIEDPKCSDYVKATLFSEIEIFAEEFPFLEKHCSDFSEKINAFISEVDEGVAKTGIEIHKYFLQKVAPKLQKDLHWETVIKKLQQVLSSTLPKKLLDSGAVIASPKGDLKLGFAEPEILSKSLTHLNIVNYVRNAVIKESVKHMPLKASLQLLETLHESANFAHEFNKNVELRLLLQRAGFRSQSTHLPTLIHQEREALSGYFELSFEVYRHNDGNKEGQEVLENMWGMMKEVLEEHIKVQGQTGSETGAEAELRRLVLGKQSIISESILQILQKVPASAFKETRDEVLGLLVDLVISESAEIRAILRHTLKSWIKQQK